MQSEHVTDTDIRHRCIHCGTWHDTLARGYNVYCVNCGHLTATELDACPCFACEALARLATSGEVPITKTLADVLAANGWAEVEHAAPDVFRLYRHQSPSDDRILVYRDRVTLCTQDALGADRNFRFRDEEQAMGWITTNTPRTPAPGN